MKSDLQISYIRTINGLLKTLTSKDQSFYYDPEITDPMQIAMKDDQLFVVDKVLDHSGDPNGSRRLLTYMKLRRLIPASNK